MATNLTENKSFEDKLKDKIKDSIGNLITDEDLSKLVNRSLEEIFFTPRKNPKKTYYSNNEPETIPPFLHDIVRECLQPSVNKAVKDYIENNPEEVLDVIRTIVTEGVGNAVVKAMNMQFQSQILTFQQNITNQLNQPR